MLVEWFVSMHLAFMVGFDKNSIRLGSWLLLQSTDGCVKCQGINLVCYF